MKIEDMIAVLEAAKRGEKIECKGKMADWRGCPDPLWSFDTNEYRIAPKNIVSELRAVNDLWKWKDLRELCKRAADRIEELEKINDALSWRSIPKDVAFKQMLTTELLAEIARRVK